MEMYAVVKSLAAQKRYKEAAEYKRLADEVTNAHKCHESFARCSNVVLNTHAATFHSI